MRLEWIRCFEEVVHTTSFTKAAQNLYITQPAVTKIIRSLETEVGEKLLIRSTSGVTLTEAGKIFHRFARRILQDYNQYLLEMNQYKDYSLSCADVIELAISPLLLQAYYQSITQQIAQHFPQVTLRFVETDIDTSVKLISDNPQTLGLTLYNEHFGYLLNERISVTCLCETEVVICASNRSRYASLRSITPQDIPFEKIISIEFGKGKDNPIQPNGTFNFYTTNLALVKQKLLDDAEVCVSLPRLIAEKELISPEIVQLDTVEKTAASIIFLYNKSG